MLAHTPRRGEAADEREKAGSMAVQSVADGYLPEQVGLRGLRRHANPSCAVGGSGKAELEGGSLFMSAKDSRFFEPFGGYEQWSEREVARR